MGEIVERNKAAQGIATKLRRELQELIEEAVKLGVLDADEDDNDDKVEELERKEELVPLETPKSHPLETWFFCFISGKYATIVQCNVMIRYCNDYA